MELPQVNDLGVFVSISQIKPSMQQPTYRKISSKNLNKKKLSFFLFSFYTSVNKKAIMTLDEIKALPIEERQVKLLELYNSTKRDCSMFSSAGNRRVQALISKCMKKVVNKKAIRKEEFEKFVQEQIDKVAKDDRYSEIQDTAVGEVISFWLKRAVNVAGYEWNFYLD